jgi:hypothetical protein
MGSAIRVLCSQQNCDKKRHLCPLPSRPTPAGQESNVQDRDGENLSAPNAIGGVGGAGHGKHGLAPVDRLASPADRLVSSCWLAGIEHSAATSTRKAFPRASRRGSWRPALGWRCSLPCSNRRLRLSTSWTLAEDILPHPRGSHHISGRGVAGAGRIYVVPPDGGFSPGRACVGC